MTQTLTKILYVEDEADIRAIAQIALEDLGGFTVEYCASGFEALEKAESFQPQLLLLDVMMPKLDGPATLEKLREIPSLKNIPAIFMTARIQDNEIQQYRSLGILDVITKPFDPMTLSEKILQCWSNHHE